MSEGGGDPVVSLVVVNYNGAASIGRCVESLLQPCSVAAQIFVVDNASTDSSLAVLLELVTKHPMLHLIRSDCNLGYSGAVNLALPSCRGRYVAVLNMDVVAEPGWLEPLVAHLNEHPQVGAVCPLITLMDGRTVNAIGQDLHVTGLGFNRDLGLERPHSGGKPVRTAGLHGAAFLVRRDILARIGGMDRDGFLYHEDVRLSWMIRLQGHDIACLPSAAVRHDYFLSMHPEKLYLLERNRWRLLLSVLHPATLLIIAPLLFATEAMAWGFAALRGRAFLLAKARSYAALFDLRREIAMSRRRIQSQRRVSDFGLLLQFRIAYAWQQFGTLARERGPPRRAFGDDHHRPGGH